MALWYRQAYSNDGSSKLEPFHCLRESFAHMQVRSDASTGIHNYTWALISKCFQMYPARLHTFAKLAKASCCRRLGLHDVPDEEGLADRLVKSALCITPQHGKVMLVYNDCYVNMSVSCMLCVLWFCAAMQCLYVAALWSTFLRRVNEMCMYNVCHTWAHCAMVVVTCTAVYA